MNEKVLIPLSILIAGFFIGIAVYMTTNTTNIVLDKESVKEEKITAKRVDPEKDHISGSKNAEIFLIEYSDLECNFCKNYNKNVIKKLEKKYKDNQKVSFVFRNFPLSQRHPSSFEEAVSLECASELGGDQKFFEFKEKIFAETASDGKFSSQRLTEIARELGLKAEEFNSCLKDEKSIKKVSDSYDEAISLGLNSTPSVFLQTSAGQTYSIPADLEVTENLIEAYLADDKQK
jgi:protein-disulfide isomerase